MAKTYGGVDPGLNGAICLINDEGVQLYDMPTIPSSKDTRELDLPKLFSIFKAFSTFHKDILMVLEESLVMPKQGAVSGKTIGFQAGALQMALVATGLPHVVVKPALWKKVMLEGLPKVGKTEHVIQSGKRKGEKVISRDNKAVKAQSILLAKRLCPNILLVPVGSRVESADRAEAFLLAKYGERLGL